MKKKILMLVLLMTLFFPTSAFALKRVACGNITGMPSRIPYITSSIVVIAEFAVPIIIIISGSIDLVKGIAAQKEDEIKKGQQILIKKFIVAGILFSTIAIVKFVISVVSDKTNSNNVSSCISCFINYKCSDSSETPNPDLYNPMKY